MAGGTVLQVDKTASSFALLLGNQRERCENTDDVTVQLQFEFKFKFFNRSNAADSVS